MAEKDKQTQENPEESKSKGGKKKWIFMLLLLVLIGGGGAGYWFFLSPSESESGDQTSADRASQAPLEERLVELPPFVVNLSDPLGRRFLKVTMNIEMQDEEAALKAQQSMPKIKDSILLLLSSKSFNNLTTMEDKLLLKRQIIQRVNQTAGSGKAQDVYFTEFVIQ